MISYLDENLAGQIHVLGGIQAIAISHPHFYGSKLDTCEQGKRWKYWHADPCPPRA